MPDTQNGRHCSRWRRWAKAAYEQIPASWRCLLRPLVYCYQMYDEIRPRFWIGESQGRDDGLLISVLCVAGAWERSSLFGQVFGGRYRERCVGRAWLWHLPKVLVKRGTTCCATVVHVRPSFRRFLARGKWLCIPAWVVGEVGIPLPPDVLATGNVKEDLRKIRRHALGYEVTRDPRHFDDFYNDMYVPHARRVFGPDARVWPPEVLRKHLENGELLLVSREGRYVAGQLISYCGPEPLLLVLGVRDGNREFVRMGAAGATYHYAFWHMVEKGFTKAGVGKSKAFLNDGVLQYKKKLGMEVIGVSDGYLYLGVVQDTDASRAFLKANPLIFEDGGKLTGAVFADGDLSGFTQEDFARIDREFSIAGLTRILLVLLDSSASVPAPPPELAERISVCHVSEILEIGFIGRS